MQNEPTSLNPNDDKRAVLTTLFRMVHGGQKAMGKMADYLKALQSVPIEELRPACELLRETWAELYAPLPGHIRAACAKFAQKSAADIRYELDRQRMAYAKANMMTPQRVLDELARVHDIPLPEDDFERRVETKRRAGLERILARWEGEEPPPLRIVRKRGEGGLSPASALVGDMVGAL